MNQIDDRTTVVLAGSFNPGIFIPKWVSQHGLQVEVNEQTEVEIMAAVGAQNAPSRLRFDDFSYGVGQKSFILHLAGLDNAICNRNVAALANMLHVLPHTPIKGVGFNFAFAVQEPGNLLQRICEPNAELLDAFGDREVDVPTGRWGNSVTCEGALVNVDCEWTREQVTISLNFHYAVESAAEAEDVLRMPEIFQRNRELARSVARHLSEQQLDN